MTQLLSALEVFPDFLRFLRVFGSKAFAQDEGYSGYHVSSGVNVNGQIQTIGRATLLYKALLVLMRH